MSKVNLSVAKSVACNSVEARSVSSKRQKINLAYEREDIQAHVSQQRYKGLINPNNRCYFNAVIQCLLYSPLARRTIEMVAQSAQSVDVLCEICNLFNKMTAIDAATSLSPSTCFKAVMNTKECKAFKMRVNKQEDAHEFLLRLLDHLDEQLCVIAETFNFPYIFNLHVRSTTACQRCLYYTDKTEYSRHLSLHFPVGYCEDALDCASRVLHINSLIDTYFRVETLFEHHCSQCGFIGGTEKKLDMVKAPQLLLLQLSRFGGGIVKIQTLVEFTTELSTDWIIDGNGQQIRYRLTGMIRHTGSSIAAGHYIAYVLIDGNWYEANDERMGLVTWATVRSLQAYMLFYERQ